jgi:CDP-diacylglycerol--glycerol-3-phosphate 3-phosphatidyltransferase
VKTRIKDRVRGAVVPVASALAGLGVTPNHLTLFGLVASAAGGALLAWGRFRTAALALLLGGLADMLDGAVAREAGCSTRFGAFLDSTVDRYAEMLVFAGLLVYFIRVEDSTIYALLTFLAAGGSYMVSYTRARAEGLGLRCDVGLMERPERLILILVAILIGPLAVKFALWVLTGLVTWTSWQRIRHVLGETRSP